MSLRYPLQATIAAAALLLAAITPGHAEERAKIRIVFPTTATTFELPHFVAQDQGWLAKAGLDIEEIWVSGDANAIRAVISGRGDIAAPGTFAVYPAIAEGAKIKAIASWQPLVDYVLIAKTEITSLQQLTHARIAAASLGSLTTELPRMVMEKHGVDASGASFFSVGGHEARLQAVLAGKADAALVSALYAAQGRRLGKVNILSDMAREYPGLGYTYLIVNGSEIAAPERRRALELYIKFAVVEASRFIMKEPQKSAEIMHKRAPGVDMSVIQATIAHLNQNKSWGINGGLDPKVTSFTISLANTIKASPRPVTTAEVIDQSIVEHVIAEVGRQ